MAPQEYLGEVEYAAVFPGAQNPDRGLGDVADVLAEAGEGDGDADADGMGMGMGMGEGENGMVEGMLGDDDPDGVVGLDGNESTIQLDAMLAEAAAAADVEVEEQDRSYDDEVGGLARSSGVRIRIEDDDEHRNRFEIHHRRPFHHHSQQHWQQLQQQQQHHFADIDGDDERGDECDQERPASLRLQIQKSSDGNINSSSHADSGSHVALNIREFRP